MNKDTVLLDVDRISISFGGIKAVQDVSFQIHRGEILGLIGPNGSGKSTCVNMIAGNYKPDSGKITFDGTVLTENHKIHHRSRLGIGRTFQTPKPFGHLSVFQNVFSIALLKNDFDAARIKTEEVLRITKLDEMRDMRSEKLPIEKRKWLDFARVLATDPKLVMLDECLGGLTATEMEESLKLVRKINEELGISILFIEHVIKAVASLCSRVIVFNEGHLLAEGEPNEVLKSREVISAYIGGDV